MFSCRKCNSNLKDTDRYCYGCGAYIGEPAVRSDEWQEQEDNGEEIQYEYNEEGKIVRLHCEKCDAIVEKYHKYCSNCGKNLENNTKVELVEPKTEDESSMDSENQKTASILSGLKEKYGEKIVYFIKKSFSNKKLVAAVFLILVLSATGVHFYKQFNKPVVRYEQDPSYKAFVRDEDWMYYSYFYDAPIKELQAKRGTYKIKTDGSNMTKLCDNPAALINIYKEYIYYLNVDDRKIYRMKKDGSDNKKVSDEVAASLLVDRGYIYYRDKAVLESKDGTNTLFRMKLDGTEKKEISKDVLTYNIVGNYIYYSSRSSLGEVYRIKTDGSHKKKMCKIDGSLKYIKDDYIYYTMKNENIIDRNEYADAVGYISRVKLNGTNSTKLSSKEVLGFLLYNNNIYYENIDDERVSRYLSLYKADCNGKSETKIAEKIDQIFCIDNEQVYYIDYEYFLPYKKDFKGSNRVSLLGISDELIENYKIEAIKLRTMQAQEIEDLNNDISNGRVAILNKKGDNKTAEGYNTKHLDVYINGIQAEGDRFCEVAKFIKDGSNTNLDELIQLQSDGKRIIYISFKKDTKNYKVDKILFFESMIKKEQDNTVKYYLIEKKGDPEDKWKEILSINRDAIKS